MSDSCEIRTTEMRLRLIDAHLDCALDRGDRKFFVYLCQQRTTQVSKLHTLLERALGN